MLSAEILRPDALDARCLAAWEGLRTADPALRNPLFGPRWAQTVGRVRPDAHVAVLRRDGAPVAFLPHQRGRNGTAHPMGAPFSDFHALIVEPGLALSLEEAVAAAGLRAFRYSGLLDPENRVRGRTEGVVAHVLKRTPGEDLIEFVRSRNVKRFRNWRRLDNKLEREHGAVSVAMPDPDPGALSGLMRWKSTQLRRNNLHDVYRPAWVQALMRNLLADVDPAFGGMQATLRVNGRPVAGEFGLREGDCLHPWIAGYDPEFAPYSPGIVLQLRMIEAMEPLGLIRYDLGPSSDHYKAAFSTGEFTLKAGVARAGAGGPGAWLSDALSRSPVGARLQRRWDQIDAGETTLSGRARALADALGDAPKRLGTRSRETGQA